MKEETAKMREHWISEAEVLLGAGKGHLGVINYLRAQGVDNNNAKTMSYDIFDNAKCRLMKSQRGQIIFGWGLVALGVLTPLALFIFQARVVYLSTAPIIAGIFTLSKVVNPSRLPEERSNPA